MIAGTRPGGGASPGPAGEGGARRPRWRGRPRWLLAVGLVAAFWLGGFAATNLGGTGTRAGAIADRLFPRVDRNLLDSASIGVAWDDVRSQYVVRDVSPQRGTGAAVAGIVDMLHTQYGDRFSQYFSAEQYRTLQDSLSGKRAGVVGIELAARCADGAACAPGQQPSVVAVTGVVHQSPAEKAGVHDRDVLLSVDGRSIASLGGSADERIDKAGPLIRGSAGTTVRLGISRRGTPMSLTISRVDLTLPAAFAQRFGAVVYLQVTAFDQNVAAESRRLLSDALSSGATAVVLDLRHDPGGLVSEAQDLASQFLAPGGDVHDVVVRKGRLDQHSAPSSAQTTERDQVKSGGAATTVRLAVLVDQDSASAAEIVAAALKDYHRGRLVGAKSFGKGSVQEDFGLPDGSDLHLTVEKWFSPSGASIDGSGITPDSAVALPDDDHRFRLDAQGADPGSDAQLQAALAAVQG